MKVGDKVKVKSWEEILKTLNENFCCTNLNKDSGCVYFNKRDMSLCIDLTGTISEINKGTGNVQIKFKEQNCIYYWHPSWLELIPEGGDYWDYQSKHYQGSISKEELKTALTQTDIKYLETQIKTENYENKLQRKKSTVIRGTVPEGSVTCGRKRKTSIAVGYLSNSVCIGG